MYRADGPQLHPVFAIFATCSTFPYPNSHHTCLRVCIFPGMTRVNPLSRIAIALALLVALAGCRSLGISPGGGSPRLESVDAGTYLDFRPTLAAYSSTDENSAELYFTDLAPGDLLAQADLKNTWGQFIHIRHYLQPKAGETPIDSEANSIIIRHIVIADGQIGLYGGGGFMFDSGKPGDSSFGGSIPRASMKLLAHTPGFVDRIGLSHFGGSLSAKQDLNESERLRKGLNVLLAKIPRLIEPVKPAATAADSKDLLQK